MSSPKIVSLFSGCGGLDLGFTKAGFSVVWANEYDKTIWPTYEANHPEAVLNKQDIRKVTAESLPHCDGLIGGPPCQSWSVAGAKAGDKDPRGQLFLDYIRILKAKQPSFFLAENVPGILSSKHKDALNKILSLFAEAGYKVSYKKLNCADYGIPQERERVFFIGYKTSSNKVFDFNNVEKLPRKTLFDAIENIQYFAVKYPQLSMMLNHEYVDGGFSSQFMSRQRVRTWDEPSFTILASARHAALHPQASPMIKVTRDIWKFDPKSPAPYRRLTVRECARIQTFPDSFKFLYSNISNGYKMVGNAVPVDMAMLLAQAIKQDLY